VKYVIRTALVASAFAGGVLFGRSFGGQQQAHAAPQTRVFEIRTYTAPDGKLDALNARFRNHTTRLFEKHGMQNIGYWIPQDSILSQNTLVYILAHESREAARQSWAAFGRDPEWRQVARETEANGRIVARIESRFLEPTDYSPMK